MTVGTHGPEVSDGVDLVVRWNQRQFFCVVDVDEILAERAIAILE